MKNSSEPSTKNQVRPTPGQMRTAARAAVFVHISEVLADVMPILAAEAFSAGDDETGGAVKTRPGAFAGHIIETPAG